MNSTIKNKLKTALPAYPIEKAWLFGSYSRGEENANSDIDLLVRFEEGKTISLFDYIRIVHSLEDILNHKVDMVQENCLKPFAKESVERDKVLIYERKSKR